MKWSLITFKITLQLKIHTLINIDLLQIGHPDISKKKIDKIEEKEETEEILDEEDNKIDTITMIETIEIRIDSTVEKMIGKADTAGKK